MMKYRRGSEGAEGVGRKKEKEGTYSRNILDLDPVAITSPLRILASIKYPTTHQPCSPSLIPALHSREHTKEGASNKSRDGRG